MTMKEILKKRLKNIKKKLNYLYNKKDITKQDIDKLNALHFECYDIYDMMEVLNDL